MSSHTARVLWQRQPEEAFTDKKYSRRHTWIFDGGLEIPASPSPQVVPLPYSAEENVDPEEAYIASLSSCHMLFFLDLISREGFAVDSYDDSAIGEMTRLEKGRHWVSKVTLNPKVTYHGTAPAPEKEAEIHHRAHDLCFIANSVKTEIVTVLV